MALAKVHIDDKYDLDRDRIYVTGAQAVVRMCMMQRELDCRNGLNTAGFISGYRGSPIGSLDLELFRIKNKLDAHNLVFQPGLNEDLAATAIWGTQQAELRGEGLYDGVFGLWYGKGPGVDRSGDVFRHANHAGTSKHGGVVALMGDDHTCESSTSAHQSEFAFVDAMIPVLNPAGVQEIVDYGLFGWALSRFAGVWTGLKCVKDNIEQTASIDGRLDRFDFTIPSDFEMPEGGLNIRLGDQPLAKEARLHDYKRLAILSFARANSIDKMIYRGGPSPKIGVVTAGKSYLDTAEAFDLLGIDEVKAANLGIRLYKIGLAWPLESEGITKFADGLDLIIVIEEKRSLIETQIKEQLYGTRGAPMVIGKRDESGNWLFPAKGALDPILIARILAERIAAHARDDDVASKLTDLQAAAARSSEAQSLIERIPYFCAGCPHNSSTVVPEGSRAYAGIGCHYMVQWMDRETEGFTHMGGEGANWTGEAWFSKRPHVFQNIGDGTYAHSGSLSIRAAVASGVNMTFKILYNDAVAMTGGQQVEGNVSVPQLARQVVAEGVSSVRIVTDEPDKYPYAAGFPSGTTVHHRDDIQAVQMELRDVPGVSVLIYDQTCAAEKRRRRKRGLYPDPPKRVLINELVCEGCGDCGVQSNCVAILPVETEFGRKRTIDQSACNKDFSCLKGFCPSFVTVHGGERIKGIEQKELAGDPLNIPVLPEPDLPPLDKPYSVVVTGVGGTGVVTFGAIIGMAGHLEGKGVGIIDMSGLAQKGGAVSVHIRVSAHPQDIKAIRASAAGADLVVGGDMVVAASDKLLPVIRAGKTSLVINSHEIMTADFTHRPDHVMPMSEMRSVLTGQAGEQNSHFIDAHYYAKALFGDPVSANLFLLGYAYQRGTLPVSSEAFLEAIRLNGIAVEKNIQAFRAGRLASFDRSALEKLIISTGRQPQETRQPETIDGLVARRTAYLTAYQDAAYGERYRDRVDEIRALEADRMPEHHELSDAVARSYFKLLSYKDEYEVARLYTNGAFERQLAQEFKGKYKLRFHLAPPILARKDRVTGIPKKISFGPWMMGVFKLLALCKGLRGTAFDPFGYGAERKFERQLITRYEAQLDQIARHLKPETYAAAVELASLPLSIRGFGHVKRRNAELAADREQDLLNFLKTGKSERRLAAE